MKLRKFTAGILTIAYMSLLVVFAEDTSKALMNSVMVCLEIIIPSLYAFMVISGFVISSDLYVVLSKPFGLVSRYIFRIPPELFSVLIISSVGGYPVGAKLLSELCEENKIGRKTAERLLPSCYLAGPAFICGIAGVRLFSSVKAGMMIFASIILTNVIIALLNSVGQPVPPKKKNEKKQPDLTFDKLMNSVYSGAEGIASICAVIVFFSSVICILENLGIISSFAHIISGLSDMRYSDSLAAVKAFIEISNISQLTANDVSLMPLTASLLSFGGLCVIMQVKGITGDKFSMGYFFFFRISAMFISYFICKFLMFVFDLKCLPAAYSAEITVRQSSPIPSLFLLIMTILLLSNISIAKSKKV